MGTLSPLTDPLAPPPAPRSHPPPEGLAVSVDGLVKRYSRLPVVDGIDLRIRQGEIFGLLGANGAGKTTAVECVQGLRRADAGRIRVLGLDPVADRSRLRTLMGVQLQDAALPDRLRVGEAVALFDRSASRRHDAILDRWGLGGSARTSFADLSGGQRQRLFIVLALLNQPRIVFLDELTQGLDPAARRDVWAVIRQVRDSGTTVVLVSHFADEVEALCDRVAVLSQGRIVDTGSPRELTDRHAPVSTVTFTPPAAFDRAALERITGVERVTLQGQRAVVTGAAVMVAPVCAASLDRTGAGPPDLRVSHASLNDALVNLIGARQ